MPRTSRGRRVRNEDGSILVLAAVLLPMLLLFCAIVIDVGYWWVNGKKAQIAADSCALAAAQHLERNYDQDHCRFGAPVQDYVLINIPPNATPEVGTVGTRWLSTKVTSPYRPSGAPYPDPSLVEAVVKMRVRTFFGALVGVDSIDITRRAVAERLDAPGNMAIFSYSDNCSESLLFNAENVFVNGLIHSNGQFRVDTGPFWAADGTHNKPRCPASVDGDVAFAQFGEDKPPPWGDDCAGSPCRLPRDDVFQDWPAWYTPAQFGWLTGCNYHGETIQIDNTHLKIKDQPDIALQANPDGPGTIIPSGTYCATKSFQIGGNDHKGVITALSPEITIDGNGQDYTPYENGVLFFTVPNRNVIFTDDGPTSIYCDHTNKMILNGMNYKWAGVIFHPCEEIVINNNDSVIGNDDLVGTILGYKVRINGCCFEMVGTGESEQNVNTALVE